MFSAISPVVLTKHKTQTYSHKCGQPHPRNATTHVQHGAQNNALGWLNAQYHWLYKKISAHSKSLLAFTLFINVFANVIFSTSCMKHITSCNNSNSHPTGAWCDKKILTHMNHWNLHSTHTHPHHHRKPDHSESHTTIASETLETCHPTLHGEKWTNHWHNTKKEPAHKGGSNKWARRGKNPATETCTKTNIARHINFDTNCVTLSSGQ